MGARVRGNEPARHRCASVNVMLAYVGNDKNRRRSASSSSSLVTAAEVVEVERLRGCVGQRETFVKLSAAFPDLSAGRHH
jgi:hypothetical protein